MRFGGLVAIDDLSFTARPARDHRDHRPERRRQDHGVQLPDRLLQADRRPADASTPTARELLLEQMEGFRIARAGRRPDLPEHPPVRPDERAREPDRRAAQRADARLGLHRARRARLSSATATPKRRRSSARATGWTRIGLTRARRLERRQPALRRRSAGSRSRARCAPRPKLLCLDEPAAGLNPRETGRARRAAARDPRRVRHRRAADRARHERGHGHLRPHRRARLRPQDRRRLARGDPRRRRP